MAPPGENLPSLDAILHQITTSNNVLALNHTLRSALPKDVRDTILASALAGGQDPLTVLDAHENTLGILYIMSARLRSNTSPPPPFSLIGEFCRNFSPDQARLAPDRVTLLAKGIKRLAEEMNNLKLAIQPLHDLLVRYPYHLSYLTTIHPLFLRVCVASQQFSAALPILSQPITAIDTSLCDLHYNDNLVYHYTGGIALAALKRWAEAEEFFEICVSSPGQAPAAIQMEAMKKLVLVQLISRGKTANPPKYTHPILLRLFKNTPYTIFVNSYPHQTEQLRALVEKEKHLFSSDKNTGLIEQALQRAPRWAIKKLTATYLTLGLRDIGRAVKIDDEDQVRALILSMIESSEISAQISADGTVTFSDPPPQFTKEQVDMMLQQAQEQSALLARLEMDLTRSREYILKAAKNKDEGWNAAADEEMIFLGSHGAPGSWIEDTMFA